MTNWDHREARSLVLQRFGQEQCDLATQSQRSTIDRLEYARFHYDEVREIIDTRIKTLHERGRLSLVMLGGGTDDERNEYEDSCVQLGAHVVACVQNLHAIADIFAHTVYYSLGYNLQPDAPKERDVTSNLVKNRLRPKHKHKPEHKPLAEGLGKLTSHPHAKYLGALANLSKHRSLVKLEPWLDMTGLATEPLRLEFPDFRYDDGLHARRVIGPFLESAFNQISEIVFNTGVELTVALRAQLAEPGGL